MKSKLGLLALGLVLGSVGPNTFGANQKQNKISGALAIADLRGIINLEAKRADLAKQGLTLLPLTEDQKSEQSTLRAKRDSEYQGFLNSPRGRYEQHLKVKGLEHEPADPRVQSELAKYFIISDDLNSPYLTESRESFKSPRPVVLKGFRPKSANPWPPISPDHQRPTEDQPTEDWPPISPDHQRPTEDWPPID